MITPEQFQTQFDRLCAAFSINKSEKILDQWHREFEDCEIAPFQKAMRRCMYAERFPTWDAFKQQYINCVGIKAATAALGCPECSGGYVTFKDYRLVREGSEVRVLADMVANCICSKDKRFDMAIIDRRKLSLDVQCTYWTQRALDSLKEAS